MAYYGVTFNNGDELLHYGIKGMKWRKRRKKKFTNKKTSSRNDQAIGIKKDIRTDYTNTTYEYLNPSMGGMYGVTYESNDKDGPGGKSPETFYKKSYMEYGSKYVKTLAGIKKTVQLSNLKITKAALSLCDSKAPTSLKLLGLGTALAAKAVSNKIVKTTNTMMIKSKMKKK